MQTRQVIGGMVGGALVFTLVTEHMPAAEHEQPVARPLTAFYLTPGQQHGGDDHGAHRDADGFVGFQASTVVTSTASGSISRVALSSDVAPDLHNVIVPWDINRGARVVFGQEFLSA